MVALYANFDWLNKNSETLEKYAGKWIAIGDQKLLAVADTLKKLYEDKNVQKAKEPLVTKIPLAKEAYSLL